MKIITVSREFGSGGRELGRRLAEQLGYDYYDGEILSGIAEKCNVGEDYAEFMITHSFPAGSSITLHNSFHAPAIQKTQVQLLRTQTDIIREIAKKGRDFVVVGRNADLILAGYRPFNIFVTADMPSKLKRCMERSGPDEKLSEKDMIANIKEIDRHRKKNRELISDLPWGDRRAYDLILNTSGTDIARLAPSVAALAETWFDSRSAN